MAHALDRTTVAEGVEDAATLKLLRELGVDQAQGYFLGRPTPIDFSTSLRLGAPLPRSA